MLPWKDLRGIAEQLYMDNPYLSPYQSYDFLTIVGLGRVDKNPFACWGYKPYNFVLYRDDKPVVIAPFYCNSGKKKKLLLRGQFTSAGHLDFIYSQDFEKSDFDFLIKYIKNFFGSCFIEMDRISERSLTCKYAKQCENTEMKTSVLVSVVLPETYDQWYLSLSKSVRQNIRTSYNRMKTDNKHFSYSLFYGQPPNKKTRADIIRLFARRLCEHSKIRSRVLEKYLRFAKARHPMTKGIDNDKSYVGAVLYIDGSLAAFFNGFVGNDNRILVPRLAINMDFNRYAPGGILINETMKTIKDAAFAQPITEFDLQRGDESYKYSYGGTEYYGYSFTF